MGKTYYQAGKDFIVRRIAGETVLVPVGSSSFNGMLTFNETGDFLWKKVLDGCAAEDLAEVLREEYEVTEEIAVGDVSRFLEFCLKSNLLELKKTT